MRWQLIREKKVAYEQEVAERVERRRLATRWLKMMLTYRAIKGCEQALSDHKTMLATKYLLDLKTRRLQIKARQWIRASDRKHKQT